MPWGLLCALGASLCYGIGSVLQAAAAAQAAPTEGLDPRLMLRLARSWRYVTGLALDAVGFALSLIALRSLPLYAVQSIVASFLAVTAVAGTLVLGLRLRRQEVAALVTVVVGLVLVGLSAAPESAQVPGAGAQWLLLAAAVALALACVPLGRLTGRRGAFVLGAAAGVAFGLVAIAGRLLSAPLTGSLLHDLHLLVAAPASYAALVAAPSALITYATALQRGTVVQATAPLVVGETVLPAIVGLLLLGDRARTGWGAVGIAGFVLAVGASLMLARFGEVEAPAVRTAHPTGRS